MRNLVLLFLACCISTVSLAQTGLNKRSIEILPDSQLTITGDTNISKFSCSFNSELLPQNLEVTYSTNSSQIDLKNAVLVLNNNGFNCGNRQINNDFHSLLKTEEHPEIKLEIKRIILEDPSKAKADVIISIAGKQNRYTIPVRVVSQPATCFEGSLELDIKDFSLEPPKKMFGIIKVKDDIVINFNLSVEK